jgi:Arc/MetJ-type ribon-helix-helix transcriptional regulator
MANDRLNQNKITIYLGPGTERTTLDLEVERTFESRSHVIRRIIREWTALKQLIGR